MTTNVKFLRQIPYIRGWLTKEVQAIYLISEEKQVENLGHTIIHEGDPCDKVIIIVEGEVEIYKKKLNTLYFNM